MNVRAINALLAAFALTCALSTPPLHAAEQAKKPTGIASELDKIYLRADHREFDTATGVAVVSGNVRFLAPHSNQLIAADAGVIWVQRREAYLEGNIRIYKTLGPSAKAGRYDVPKPNSGERKGLEPIESIEPAGDVDNVVEPEAAQQKILIDTRKPVSEAQRVYMNWADGTAYLVEPTLRFTEAGNIADFVVHAPSAEEIATYRVPIVDKNGKPTGKYESQRHLVANGAMVTTCSFKKPHTQFDTTSVEFVEGDFARLKNVVFGTQDVPLLYLPYAYKDLEYDWPSLILDFGNSSHNGYFASTRLRTDIMPGMVIEPHVDAMSERGVASGIDAHYAFGRGNEIRGALVTFWLPHDDGTDALADTSLEGSQWKKNWPAALGPMPHDIPLGETDRYRVSFWHQQEYPEHWELDIEVNKFSDADVYREYFDLESKTAKQPQDRAELVYRRDNWSAFVQVATRLNDFETQTEYLPQFGFNLINQPLGGGFLFTSQTQVANVRTKFANTQRRLGQTQTDIVEKWMDEDEYNCPPSLTLRQNDTDDLMGWRFDSVNTVSRPFKVGIVNIEPYVGVRESWFQHTLDRGRGSYSGETPPVGPPLPPDIASAPDKRSAQVRSQVLAGARAATEFWHTYDVSDRPGLRELFPNGMRHIITPEVNYVFESIPTVRQAELPQNDEVTEQDGMHRVNFELRNRWQTRPTPTINPEPGAPLGGEWYRRKLAAELAQESAPYNVIDFDNNIDLLVNDTYLRDYYTNAKRTFSNLRTELAFRPNRKTTIFTDTEYNVAYPDSGAAGWETISAGVMYQPTERLALSLREDYHRDDVTLTRIGTAWDINPKWAVGFDCGVDFAGNGKQSQALNLTRRFHEWQVTFSFSYDKGRQESVSMVQIGPSTAKQYRPSWLFQPGMMQSFYFLETQQ